MSSQKKERSNLKEDIEKEGNEKVERKDEQEVEVNIIPKKKKSRRYRRKDDEGVQEKKGKKGEEGEEGDEEDEEENGEEERIKEALLETKERQKMRQRAKGVDLTVTESSAAESWNASRETRTDNSASSLGSTFTQQSRYNPVDQQLEKYIQERMKKSVPATEGGGEKRLTDADLLYMIPEELQVKKRLPKETETSGAEASVSHLTGIVEVELPVTYKLKNIEETEAARRRMEVLIEGRNQTSSSPSSSSSSSASYPPNGGVGEVKTNTMMFSSSGIVNSDHQYSAGGKKREQQATDDLAVERFKKHFRY